MPSVEEMNIEIPDTIISGRWEEMLLIVCSSFVKYSRFFSFQACRRFAFLYLLGLRGAM